MTALGREFYFVVRQFVSILNQISCQPVHNLTLEFLLRATVNKLLDFEDNGTAMCLMTTMNNIVDALREPLDTRYILYNYLISRCELVHMISSLKQYCTRDISSTEIIRVKL